MGLYKRGDVWWYHFEFGGKHIQESAKTKSKTVAKEAERQRHRELERGYNGLADQRGERIRTFSDLAGEYLEDYRLRHKGTAFATYAVGHVVRHLGALMVVSISESTVTGYQTARLSEGAAHKSINEEVGFLLRILGETGDPLRLRLRRARKLKLATRERVGRALTLQERDALLAAARKRRSRHIYPALLLNIDAGMRDGEIRGLQWGRVDLEKSIVTVGTSKTQAGEGRTIPMSPTLHAALVEHARWFTVRFGSTNPEHYCFPFGNPQPTDPTRPVTSFKSAWELVKEDTGVTARFHDGRHTFVTELAEAGVSDEVIRSTVGHVSNQMLRHYSHVRTEAKRSALAAVEAMNEARRKKAEEERKMEELKSPATFSATSPVVQ